MADKLAPDTLGELERALAQTIVRSRSWSYAAPQPRRRRANQLISDLTRNLKTENEIKVFRQLAEERVIKGGVSRRCRSTPR